MRRGGKEREREEGKIESRGEAKLTGPDRENPGKSVLAFSDRNAGFELYVYIVVSPVLYFANLLSYTSHLVSVVVVRRYTKHEKSTSKGLTVWEIYY